MSTTHAAANAMLETLRQQSVYLGLLRALPDKQGNSGNEVSENSYMRQLAPFGPPADSVMRNTARIQFPPALTDWGNIVAWALFDAQSGGTMLWYDTLTMATPVTVGSHFYVDLNSLELSVGLT